jgi:monovalent cation/proton antiporter MnhG/PhaG subunit
VSGAIVWALLAVGVVAQLAGVVGVIVAADVYDRLHFTGPFCFALAVVIDEGPLSQAGIKSVLVAVLLLGLSPVLVHATARAAYVRERGRLGPLSEEPRA